MCVVPVAYIILEIIWTHAQSLQVIKYQNINISMSPFFHFFLSSFFYLAGRAMLTSVSMLKVFSWSSHLMEIICWKYLV